MEARGEPEAPRQGAGEERSGESGPGEAGPGESEGPQGGQRTQAAPAPRRTRRPRDLVVAAFALAVIATVGSLGFSGIPALNWWGLGITPCELCWYQRILMYPLVPLLGYAVWRRDDGVAGAALLLAVPGAVIALYHSLIQYLPTWQIGACGIGSCTARMWSLAGLTIPNLSLIAFVLIATLLALHRRLR